MGKNLQKSSDATPTSANASLCESSLSHYFRIKEDLQLIISSLPSFFRHHITYIALAWLMSNVGSEGERSLFLEKDRALWQPYFIHFFNFNVCSVGFDGHALHSGREISKVKSPWGGIMDGGNQITWWLVVDA